MDLAPPDPDDDHPPPTPADDSPRAPGGPAEGRRVGPAEPPTRDRIVRAALAIIDEQGLDALSMRRLGARLGVDPMAVDVGKEMPANLMVPESRLLDRFNGLRGFLDTFAVLYHQPQDLDLRMQASRLDARVVLVHGRNETRGRTVPARARFDMLASPAKTWVEFERSGHRPHFEEPAAFAARMAGLADDVLGRR